MVDMTSRFFDVSQSEFECPRHPRPEELEAVLSTVNQVIRGAKNLPPTMARDYAHVYNCDNIQNILIISHEKKVICSVGIWVNNILLGDATLRVGGINGLVTLPEYRRRGLGLEVMEAAHHRMAEIGCQVGLLTTKIPNWYRRLDWEHAGCLRTYHFNRSNINLLPPLQSNNELREAGEEGIAEMVRLRNAERLGGIREPESFGKIFAAKGKPKILLGCAGGKAPAYILTRGKSVIEWGGPAEVIGGLVRTWFKQADDPKASTSARDASFQPVVRDDMTLIAPFKGHALVTMLEQIGIPHDLDYLGMVYLLDPVGVLKAFGHREIEVSPQEDKFTLVRGNERVTLTRREMTKFFFGPERVTSFAQDLFPLPFWQWSFERV